jgi:hypothetical protein
MPIKERATAFINAKQWRNDSPKRSETLIKFSPFAF